MVVEYQGMLFSLVSSTNHNLSQRSFSLCGPWRHEASNSFSSDLATPPRAEPWGCHPPENLLHISRGDTGAGVKMTSGSPVSSRYDGHRSPFSLKSPLCFDRGEKSLVSEIHACFLFFTQLTRENLFYDWMECYHSFENCSKYINHTLVWLNEKDNIF